MPISNRDSVDVALEDVCHLAKPVPAKPGQPPSTPVLDPHHNIFSETKQKPVTVYLIWFDDSRDRMPDEHRRPWPTCELAAERQLPPPE